MNARASLNTNYYESVDFPNYIEIISSLDKRNQQTESVSINNGAVRVVNTSVNDRVSRNNMSNVSCTVNDYITVNGFNIFADNPRGGRPSRNVQFEEVLNCDDSEKARAPAQTHTVSSNRTNTSVLEPLGESRSFENGLHEPRDDSFRKPTGRREARYPSRDNSPYRVTWESDSFRTKRPASRTENVPIRNSTECRSGAGMYG